MLREGATLKAEPCPYCGGVRVMRGGHALCVGCGSEPDGEGVPAGGAAAQEGTAAAGGAAAGAAAEKAGGRGAGDAGRAVAVLERRLAEASADLQAAPRGTAARADLLDEIASLAGAIRSLESGAAARPPPPRG